MNLEIPFTYDRIAAVYNPNSTNSRRIQQEIDALPGNVVPVCTHKDYRYTRDSLYAAIEPGFVVLGLGGDGTANQLGNIMLDPEAAKLGLSDVPYVPLRGGNANDIARSYNGKTAAETILHRGRLHRMHPLEVRSTDTEGTDALRYALGYFSIGAAAEAAKALDATIRGQNRLTKYGPQQLREVITTLSSVANYPEFSYDFESATGFASDISFVRGNHIAKHGKLHANAAVAAYERVITEYAGYSGTLLNMIRLGSGRLLGTMLQAATSAQVCSANCAPLRVQYDGETRTLSGKCAEVASGSTVSVAIAEKYFMTLLVDRPGSTGIDD